MSTVPETVNPNLLAEYAPPEALPNYDSLITEDETPVDGIYSERQHRLLTDVLYLAWGDRRDGRSHWVSTDVGLFYSIDKPALAPDVMIALDVPLPAEPLLKSNRSYFIWKFGKPPDGIVEVVSNAEGGELAEKLEKYAQIRVPYYIVWDPCHYLGEQALHCFKIDGAKYAACDPWFPALGLGVTTWGGEYDGVTAQWLRWCDQRGEVLPTGFERAKRLADKLRSIGIDPDA